MLSATIDANYLPPGCDSDRLRLVAPYERNASTDTPWRNLYNPDIVVSVTTDALVEVSDEIRIKTYGQIISEYAFHPETKFLDATGAPCHRGSRGLLQRDHIAAGPWAIIGKEANQLDEVQNGVVPPAEVTTVYEDGRDNYFRNVALPILSSLSGRDLAKVVGYDRRTIDRARKGETKARQGLREKLIAIAEQKRGQP